METTREMSSNSEFLRKASWFILLENSVKVLEPLLVFACIAFYAGGEWGEYKYFSAIALVIMRLAGLGLEKGLLWYRAQVDEPAVIRAFWQSTTLAFLLGGLIVLPAVLYQQNLLGIQSDQEVFTRISALDFLAYLAAAPFFAAMLFCQQMLISKRVLQYKVIGQFFLLPVVMYGGALLAVLLDFREHALPWFFLAGHVLAFLVTFAGFLKHHPGSWKHISLVPVPPLKLLRFSLPLATTEAAMTLANRIDIILLTAFFGLTEVEVYSTAVMIANSLRTLRQSFDGILLSLLSKKSGDTAYTAKTKAIFSHTIWNSISMQIPILVVLSLLGNWIINKLLPGSPGGGLIVLIMGSMILFNTPGAYSTQLLLGLGKSMIVPVSQAVFFVLNIVLNNLLVPQYASTGAALATSISSLTGGYLVWLLARLYIKEPLVHLRTKIFILAQMSMAAIVLTLYFLFEKPVTAWVVCGLLAIPYYISSRQLWKTNLDADEDTA